MVARWLVKTEPSTYSFAQLQRDGRTVWDGVKNPMALKYLRQMRAGDPVFIYHAGEERAVVGTATAIGAAYPDPKDRSGKLAVVDLAPAAALPHPVTLAEIKSSPKCHGWELVRLPRLSVRPVTEEQWAEIERLSRT